MVVRNSKEGAIGDEELARRGEGRQIRAGGTEKGRGHRRASDLQEPKRRLEEGGELRRRLGAWRHWARADDVASLRNSGSSPFPARCLTPLSENTKHTKGNKHNTLGE
jgi:hypothetical protein